MPIYREYMSLKKTSAILIIGLLVPFVAAGELARIKYNNPGLVVDLGVGLWPQPIPVDWDGDGDNDLVVCCPDKPNNSVYFFENTRGRIKMPVFKPAVRIGMAYKNLQPSYVKGRLRLLNTNYELIDYKQSQFKKTVLIYPTAEIHSPVVSPSLSSEKKYAVRANQWKYVDYNGDGLLDIIVGVEDWSTLR